MGDMELQCSGYECSVCRGTVVKRMVRGNTCAQAFWLGADFGAHAWLCRCPGYEEDCGGASVGA